MSENLIKQEMTGSSKPVLTEDQLVNKDIKVTTGDSESIQKRLLKFSKLVKVKSGQRVVYLPAGLLKDNEIDKSSDNIFNWFLTEVLESKNTERMDRYKEYSFMVANSTIISMAVSTYANEAVQLGKVSTGVICDSKDPELKMVINKLLGKLKFNNINYLNDLAEGLAKMGDKPYAVEIGKDGVEAIEPVDPMQFHRLEKYIKVSDHGNLAFFDQGNKYYNLINNTFDKTFYDQENLEDSFKISDYRPYLLGFKIYDKVVPPWNCIHFRMFCSESGYYPYGKSTIEPVRPVYRHLISVEILLSLIKATKFNKVNYHLKLKAGGNYDNPYELFNKLNELKQNYNDHVVGDSTRHRVPSFTTDVWTVDTGDVSLEAKSLMGAAETKEGSTNDVEYLRDNLIMGLRLPKGYLIADSKGGDGKTEGDALIQQDLKLARLIYTIQSAMLSGIVRIIQIHLVTIGKEKDIHNFSLSLPYPVASYNLIELKQQSERLKLVDEFGKMLTETFGVKKPLPLKTVRRFLVDLAHMNETLVDGIIKDLEEAGKVEAMAAQAAAQAAAPQAPEPGGAESSAPAAPIETLPGSPNAPKESVDRKFDKIKTKLEENIQKEVEKELTLEWEDGKRHHFKSSVSSFEDPILLDSKDECGKYQLLLEDTNNMEGEGDGLATTEEINESIIEKD